MEKRCLQCNKIFKKLYNLSKKGWFGQKFCSKECSYLSKKGKRYSPKTEIKKGQHFSSLTEIKKGQHLSRKTEFKKGHKTWSKGKPSPIKGKKRPEVSGKKHFRWNSNREEVFKNKKYRSSTEYRIWKEKILKRDKICKMKNKNCSGRLEAHHIKSWLKYPDLRYQLKNGMLLCHFHHMYEHFG